MPSTRSISRARLGKKSTQKRGASTPTGTRICTDLDQEQFDSQLHKGGETLPIFLSLRNNRCVQKISIFKNYYFLVCLIDRGLFLKIGKNCTVAALAQKILIFKNQILIAALMGWRMVFKNADFLVTLHLMHLEQPEKINFRKQ